MNPRPHAPSRPTSKSRRTPFASFVVVAALVLGMASVAHAASFRGLQHTATYDDARVRAINSNGDQIVGHMTPGKGFVVHIETCPNINEIRRRAQREIIPARWTTTTEGDFLTSLQVNVSRRKGILAEVASEVTSADAGVDNIKVEERNAEVSTLEIGLTVRNRNHLARVMRRLRNVPAVLNLSRLGS